MAEVEVDASDEAVAERVDYFRHGCLGCDDVAELLEALLARATAADKNAEAMEAKWRALVPHGTCACSMDSPDDVCLHHSPKLSAALAELARVKGENEWRLIYMELPQSPEMVLLYDEREKDDYIVATWDAEQEVWQTRRHDGLVYSRLAFTHWRPMPVVPSPTNGLSE
jgi:hypothetical protein